MGKPAEHQIIEHRRVGDVGFRKGIAQRDHRKAGPDQYLESAHEDPAGPGQEQRRPPARIADRPPARKEAEIDDQFAELRQKRKENGETQAGPELYTPGSSPNWSRTKCSGGWAPQIINRN